MIVIEMVVLLLQGITDPLTSQALVAVYGVGGVPPVSVYPPRLYVVLVVLAPTPSVSEAEATDKEMDQVVGMKKGGNGGGGPGGAN